MPFLGQFQPPSYHFPWHIPKNITSSEKVPDLRIKRQKVAVYLLDFKYLLRGRPIAVYLTAALGVLRTFLCLRFPKQCNDGDAKDES